MRLLAVLLAMGLVAVAAGSALAAPDRASFARSRGQMADDAFDASPHREAALAKALQHGLFAKWQKDGDRVHGRFVSFNLTGDTGTLADFSYRNGSTADSYRRIFTQVTFQDFTRDVSAPNQGIRVVGSVLRVVGTDGVLTFHNNPTAGVRVHNGGDARDVTFLLAPGASIGPSADGDRSLRVNLTSFAHTNHGHIVVTNGTITKAGSSVKVHLPANATMSFLVHPSTANTARLHTLVSTMASGRLGAAGDGVVANGALHIQGDTMDVMLRGGNATSKRAAFVASGDASTPRVVVVNLHRADFPDLKNGSLEVLLAGQKLTLTNEAAVHGASGAAANVTIDKNIIIVTVNVPHFSDQAIVVQAVDAGAAPGDGGGGGIPTVGALAAVAALGAVAVGLRRRR